MDELDVRSLACAADGLRSAALGRQAHHEVPQVPGELSQEKLKSWIRSGKWRVWRLEDDGSRRVVQGFLESLSEEDA